MTSKKVVGSVLLFVIGVGFIAALAWLYSLTGKCSFLDVFLPGLAASGAALLLMAIIIVIITKLF